MGTAPTEVRCDPHPSALLRNIIAALGLLAASAGAEVPDQGDCPRMGGRGGEGDIVDATPTLIREGIALGVQRSPSAARTHSRGSVEPPQHLLLCGDADGNRPLP